MGIYIKGISQNQLIYLYIIKNKINVINYKSKLVNKDYYRDNIEPKCLMALINFSKVKGTKLDKKSAIDLICLAETGMLILLLVNPDNHLLIKYLNMIKECLPTTERNLIKIFRDDQALAEKLDRETILELYEIREKEHNGSDKETRGRQKKEVLDVIQDEMERYGVKLIA